MPADLAQSAQPLQQREESFVAPGYVADQVGDQPAVAAGVLPQGASSSGRTNTSGWTPAPRLN